VALYDEVGGDGGIAAAVDNFYERMLDDSLFSRWFESVDLHQLKTHQRAFLAVGLGGPELYDGRSMRAVHSGLGITDEIYTASVVHLGAALTEIGVDARVLRQVVRRIEMMRAAIVEVH
jgi:hemoglobin